MVFAKPSLPQPRHSLRADLHGPVCFIRKWWKRNSVAEAHPLTIRDLPVGGTEVSRFAIRLKQGALASVAKFCGAPENLLRLL